jgi:hypothetical protein
MTIARRKILGQVESTAAPAWLAPFAESRNLEKAIRSNLEGLGYGG